MIVSPPISDKNFDDSKSSMWKELLVFEFMWNTVLIQIMIWKIKNIFSSIHFLLWLKQNFFVNIGLLCSAKGVAPHQLTIWLTDVQCIDREIMNDFFHSNEVGFEIWPRMTPPGTRKNEPFEMDHFILKIVYVI